jgi:uncharacterized membrane protein (UPF0127 family)
MIKATITHLNSGRRLAESAIWAKSFGARGRGMIGRRFEGFDGMVFPRCGSVHTCMMGIPIDVLFIDGAGKVTAVHHAVKPWRAAGGKGGRTCVELPAGTLDGVKVGDEVEVKTAAAALQPDVREGDLVFIATPNLLYRRVASSSGTWTSHIGFVYKREGEQCHVAESTVPVARVTTFEKFVGRSDFAQFAVLRLKNPPDSDAMHELRSHADTLLGTPYNLWFNYDSNWQFCSKFVHDCYREKLGVELGDLVTFGELIDMQPEMPLIFWKLWYLGKLPLKKRTVTPAAQLESPHLDLVHHDPGVSLA